jgi:chromate transport protein ChrA
VRRTVAGDRTLIAVALVNAAVVVATGREIVPVLFATAAIPLLAGFGPRLRRTLPSLVATPIAALPLADPPSLGAITAFFAKSALVVFGSGLAIIPFLRSEVVEGRGWLTEPQFLDAIAVAMLTPGPVVITVAFIGWIVAGAWGGVAAAVGVFVPTWLVVVLAAPFFQRIREVAWVRQLAGGLTAAAAGALAGAVIVIAAGTLVDALTLLLSVTALIALFARPRLSEPALIAAGALAGLLLAPAARAAATTATSAPPAMNVLFVCEHGSAKSLIAKLLFEEAAREAGLEVVVESRGTDPDAEVPPWMRANLTANQMVPDDFAFTPRRVDALRVAGADLVVTFDLAIDAVPGLARAAAHERWDGMPAASQQFEASRAAIAARVRSLVDSLSRVGGDATNPPRD